MEESAAPKMIGRATFRLILYIVIYSIISIVANWLIGDFARKTFGLDLSLYSVYLNVGLLLLFGYLAISCIAEIAYWNAKMRYPHSTAFALKSVVRIIGIGALAAALAGGIAGGIAGVALGGFLGIVVGYASQNVLGQALAGLFILITRPFQIGDVIGVAGEEGTVEGIGMLFTVIRKADGTVTLIPNGLLVNNKIYRKPK
ncbi:MAG: mechanosensitive ion channel [Candidatus Hadarchaeales archaeon]